jgi:hypothetical protein
MVPCLHQNQNVNRGRAHRMELMLPQHRVLVLAALVSAIGSLACSSGPLHSAGGAKDGGGAGATVAGAGGGAGSSTGGSRGDGAAGAQAPIDAAADGGSTGLAGAGGGGGGAGAGGAGMTGFGGGGGTTGTGGTTAPFVCPGLGCALQSCPFGIKTDASGSCYTCTCNPTPDCGLNCNGLLCGYGYAIAPIGCPTCDCNPPPATPCDAQCGPPPAVPHGLCADMVHTASSSCVMDPKTGVCAWQTQVCPPTCLPQVPCMSPNYWDVVLCKCVPTYCPCGGGQLCVKTMGPPDVPTMLPPQCQVPPPNCSAADKCTCLSPLFGTCHAVTDPVLACVCQV